MRHLDIANHYEFTQDATIKFASLILGLVEIEGDYFLMYVENVYLQPPFPPSYFGIYQIATIAYLEYSRVVTNRQREIINTMKTVPNSKLRKFLISVSTFLSSEILPFHFRS